MKQIEITTRLSEDFKSASNKLENLGFKIIRQSDISDIYMTQKLSELNISNIQYILKNSVLIRKLTSENTEIKKITYKNKEYDKNGDIISEEKINLDITDIEKAQKLFECLNFEKLIHVKYHVVVYRKDDKEFAFQIVDGLGTLIEYENENDFTNKSLAEFNSVKQKMYEEIKSTGIEITKEIDVKKAYELIEKKIN